MKANQLLEGFRILDISHRLPGPLAGHSLTLLGAQVIKIEDQKFGDPFETGSFSDFDKSFKDWYKELNRFKEIKKFDFNSPTIKTEILSLLKVCDGVIVSVPQKVQEKLGIDDKTLISLNLPIAKVSLEASEHHKQSMHDLNALSLAGLLGMHIAGKKDDVIDPPFLPTSGIAFGQNIATQLLASILKAKKSQHFCFSTCYLFETARDILGPFWPASVKATGQNKFLHNGAFPCYSIYRTKDGKYVALAAVEEKFWEEFKNLFAVNLEGKDRYNIDQESFDKVSSVIKNLTIEEIKVKIKDKDVCLSIIN